ncbi:hypothetical protein KY361_04115 [Candidatus Woesearchaeota archaeon]|nr:hypothetical protein [Candidatus Woesearchaeota archaeon]
MKKVHTRVKRRLNLPRGKSGYKILHPKKRIRPKTFKTEESAHNWAARHGLKQEEYSLKKVKRNKKFQIVREQG